MESVMKLITILNPHAFRVAAEISKHTWEEKTRYAIQYITLQDGNLFATDGRVLLVTTNAYTGDFNGHIKIRPKAIEWERYIDWQLYFNIDEENYVGYVVYQGLDTVHAFKVGDNKHVYVDYMKIIPDTSAWTNADLTPALLGYTGAWLSSHRLVQSMRGVFSNKNTPMNPIGIVMEHHLSNTTLFAMPIKMDIDDVNKYKIPNPLAEIKALAEQASTN